MKLKQLKLSSFSLYVILMMCIAVLIIIWSAHTRITEHHQYHEDASLITTQQTADDVSYYIQEKKRLIHLFATRKSAALWNLLQNPDNDEAYTNILRELKSYFPNAFTFTITNHKGETNLIDFDSLMGDKCINDLHNFIKTDTQNIRIHAAETYHFDIITHFKHKNNEGVFFVSFNTDMISHSLLRAEIPGHLLLLTLPIENNLIEVTSKGARNVWVRDNYQLTKDEMDRILSDTEVENTEWTVVDLHDEELLREYRQSILIRGNLIIFILAVSGLLFMILNQHEIKRRQKAEAVKDDFLSIVSHELRTPLTAINGAITLINNGMTGELTEKTKSILSIANHNTHRLTLLVNDLLDVQKLESNQMKYRRKLIRPLDFINDAVTDIKSGYLPELCKININSSLDKELVFADRIRMEQVINNILSNAIKYGAKQGNIDINLSRKNNYIIITITDYGDGISEATKNKIFEKFTQTKMTDNRHETGSGLGLYIVKMIIKYHGGTITYISTPGKGTTFYIQLPLVSIEKRKKENLNLQ